MLGMMVYSLSRLRAAPGPFPDDKLNWSYFFWLPIDYFSVQFPIWLKQLGTWLSLHFLVYLKKFFASLRAKLFRLEGVSARLIDLVKGRSGRGGTKRGSASVFLEEIKQHQTEIRNGYK